MSNMPKALRVALLGPNMYGVDERLKQMRADFVVQNGELAVQDIDGEEALVQDILAKAEATSLFSPHKLLIIKRLGTSKSALETIEQLQIKLDESVGLILVEPSPDKRSSYYKFLQKNFKVYDGKELDNNGLVSWVVERTKESGGSISRQDAYALCERIGNNQQQLNNEITKLLLFSSQITKDTIVSLTEEPPGGTVFNLLEASFSGNRQRALQLYDNLRAQKIEPQIIFGMIVWQATAIAIMSSAGGKSTSQITVDSGLKPFVIEKASQIAKKLSREDIRKLLDSLCQVDKRLKSEKISVDDALKQVLVEI